MASRDATLSDAVAVLRCIGCNRIIQLSDFHKRFAVLVFRLSMRMDLAVHYCRLQLMRAARWRPGLAPVITPVVVSRWCTAFADDSLIKMCLATPQASLRSYAHVFLTESLVWERVQQLSDAGLLVPSSYIVEQYVRFLGFLPLSVEVNELRTRLTTNKNATKKWLKRFRERWSVQWGSTAIPHGIGESRQHDRAVIFFRWLLHAISANADAADVVVINMDETMLTSVKIQKLGNSTLSRDAAGRSQAVVRKMRPLKRTSLIASVCTAADIQQYLPQVRLISYGKSEGMPTQRVRQAYADAMYPQQAYHGTTGWATAKILKTWLRDLVNAVRRRKPNCIIVLIVDDAPSHIAEEFLRACRVHHVRLVILPAKMTWSLQPLDTHVFSQLKRKIRELLFAYQERLLTTSVPPLERIRQHGQAIKMILVDRNWTRTMQRSGFTGDLTAMRPQLRQLLHPELPTAQPPSVADLVESLQIPFDRAAHLLAILTPLASPPAVPAAALAAAAAADPGPARIPLITLTLSRSSRLPPAVPRSVAGANMWFAPPEPTRAVTRSMSRALSLSALPEAPAVAVAPAPKRARRAPSGIV